MKKSTAFWIALACLFTGIGIGFLVSPAKNGFGNNNGNTTNNYFGDEPDDYDDYDEENDEGEVYKF